MMTNLTEPYFDPKIWVLVCRKCHEFQKFNHGNAFLPRISQVTKVKNACLGRSHCDFIADGFRSGADGVLLCGCLIGNCQVQDNSQRLRDLFLRQKLLGELGVDPRRLGMEFIHAGSTESWKTLTENFIAEIRRLGPALVRPQFQESRGQG